jgi:hypothetical protein
MSLDVALGAPSGARSVGARALGTTSASVVTGITGADASALPIVYRLNAAASVRVSASSTRIVTYTIVAGE